MPSSTSRFRCRLRGAPHRVSRASRRPAGRSPSRSGRGTPRRAARRGPGRAPCGQRGSPRAPARSPVPRSGLSHTGVPRNLICSGLDFLSSELKETGDTNGKDDRHRPGHDELVHGRPRGRRADRDPERRGRPHDAVRRRVHEGRSAARRRPGAAAAGHESRRTPSSRSSASWAGSSTRSRRR